MSRMSIVIEADTYFTALAALREQHKIKPDRRNMSALADLHAAALREVDRELASVAEPPQIPALMRRQAG
jgi:hypothetical protein